jgi:hypothetical protein
MNKKGNIDELIKIILWTAIFIALLFGVYNLIKILTKI